MTLAEMRQLLYANLFEENRPSMPDATANRYLNHALQHIANLMIATDSGLASTTQTVTVSNSTGEWYWQPEISGAITYARQIVRARRENDSSGDDPWLEVITDATLRQHLTGTMQGRPKILVYNRRITFLEPENGVIVSVEYVPIIPEMSNDSDVPGQGIDTNLIAGHWQPAIVTYATIMALASEQSNSEAWRTILNDQLQSAAASEGSELQTPTRN